MLASPPIANVKNHGSEVFPSPSIDGTVVPFSYNRKEENMSPSHRPSATSRQSTPDVTPTGGGVVITIDDHGSQCVVPPTGCPVIKPVCGGPLFIDTNSAPRLAAFLEASGPPATFPFVGPNEATVTLQLDNSVTWHVNGQYVGGVTLKNADALLRFTRALKAVAFTQRELRESDVNIDALNMLLGLAGNTVDTTSTVHEPVLRNDPSAPTPAHDGQFVAAAQKVNP